MPGTDSPREPETIDRLATASRVDQATGAIREAILTGRLEPGEPFSISGLAAMLGTSVIPVREALQRLAVHGLIQFRPARTAVVAPMSAADLREIYRLRTLLEVDAASRAFGRLTARQLALLDEQIEVMTDHPRTSEQFWAAHTTFHRTLLEPATTPWLERMLEQLWHAAERYVRLTYEQLDSPDVEPRVVHARLRTAAVEGPATRVCEELAEHYRANLAWMLPAVEALESRDRTSSRSAG